MSPSLDELVKQGDGAQDAVDLGDGIFMSRNIANSYLVTTHVPPSSVWSDVVDLVGGTSPLTERAAAHAKGGRPLQALHLTDVVLAHAPADADALGAKRRALEQLLAASGRENHSEVQWLEQEIKSATVKGDQ